KTYDETNNSKFVTFDGAGNAEVRFYTPDYVETTDLEVVSPEGDVTGFRYKDLTRLWKKEGSKTYTYSTANTYPTFKNEEYAGPTLEGVLALADIKLDELDDYDVIRFDAYDGSIELTVKEIRATRYSFPNGKSKNNYTGTTEAQRKDGFEVPFIVNTTNGKTNLRDVFGMKDPQDQQKSFFIKHLSKITIKKDAAQDFDGMTPTLADGSKVKEADALNFDLALPEDVYEGFVFYTASTDGTEPADPTYADVLYNPSQNQTDDKDYEDPAFAQFYNSYEFTDADKTIIKVACFVPGCKDPKVTTLTYSRSDYNGLANNADRHGNYWYYKDGKIDKTHNGVDHNNAGWWRVENGKVNFKATGVYHNDAGWWYCKNGKVDFGYTGAGSNDAGNWYCKDGKVDFSVNGVVYAKSEGVWYYVKNNKIIPGPTVQPNAAGWWYIDKTGKVDFNHFGVEHNDAGWWRIENGKVNFNFNGIASNAAGSWYLQGGKVDFNKNGRVSYKGATYNIKGGKVV
ncbi:MAG: hypothetical protein IIZ60_02150, partial [Clostridia bacterium]|nr:hypothetical protein [Clostridia bacterium]